jgi:hypothetical protein
MSINPTTTIVVVMDKLIRSIYGSFEQATDLLNHRRVAGTTPDPTRFSVEKDNILELSIRVVLTFNLS